MMDCISGEGEAMYMSQHICMVIGCTEYFSQHLLIKFLFESCEELVDVSHSYSILISAALTYFAPKRIQIIGGLSMGVFAFGERS
jgi:hypothetical protein